METTKAATLNVNAFSQNDECRSCDRSEIPQPCEGCIIRLREDVTRLREQRNEYRDLFGKASIEVEELRKVFAMDAPCPLHVTLERLANAVAHLLDEHDCDRQGHEGDRIAMLDAIMRAREIQKYLNKDRLR